MSSPISLKKVASIYGGGGSLEQRILGLEESGDIPESIKFRSGALFKKGWNFSDLPQIGQHIGYFKKFKSPVSVCVFTTKGGVLKSTLALNLARTAALHNLRTCVVGLDIQGDITNALGYECDLEDDGDIDEIIRKLNNTKGLADFFNGAARIEDIIVQADLPNLFLIPETPELVAMNDSLSNINRREFWIKEKLIDHLKNHFDFIVMDCSPNWNKLTTNALVACDVLVSPLECKINNFRNFKVFKHFLSEFKADMRLNFDTIFVPTKYSPTKKLSMEIKKWYQEKVAGCVDHGIKESVMMEESTALYKSAMEHAGGNKLTDEMISLLSEIHHRIELALEKGRSMNHISRSHHESEFSSREEQLPN